MYALRKSLFSVSCTVVLMLLTVCAQAQTTWHVALDGSGDFTSIQAAINAASAGDTIVVAAGTYAELLDWESKDLSIQGAGPGKSVIDGNNAGVCLFVYSLTAASHIAGFTFQHGYGSNGGGIWVHDSNLNVADCNFDSNSGMSGGGIDNDYSTLAVTNCAFRYGYTLGGGGIANNYGSLTVCNCVFSFNAAETSGGGITNNYGSATVTNCAFYGNRVGKYGGGIFNNGNVTITNCILWSNSAPYGSGYYEFGSSIITNTDWQDLTNSAPDANGNFAADPLFVDAAGGDFHLQSGSPCINAGNNTVVTSPPFLMDLTNTFIIDLDGNLRISGGMVDLGAYEVQNNLAPIANAGSNQTVTAIHTGNPATDYATVTLDGSGSNDPDGDSLTYAWTDGQGHTSTAVQPTFNLAPGTYTFTLTVTDPYGASSQANVTIIVALAPNNPPVLSVPSSAAVDVGCPATFQASATDPDGDSVTYSLVNPPSWASIDSSTGLVTLAPPAGTSGTFTLTAQATDPYGASDQKSVSITVCPVIIEAVSLSRYRGIVTVQFHLRNTGSATVSNVSINSSTLAGVATKTALPKVYAHLLPGIVKTVNLRFQRVQSGTAQFVVNGTSSAGPVCTNMTVNVP